MLAAAKRKSPRPHPLIPQTACACGKSVAWLARPDGKRVPVDPHARCFLVYGGRNVETGLPQPMASTLGEFYENVSSLKLRDGREIPVERILAILPSHFGTCKLARQEHRDAGSLAAR